MPTKKTRCFTIIAYEDDPRFNEIMTVIKDKAPSWAYIMHDKDINDDKELKKPHYHFVVYFDNALSIDGVFRKFDCVIPQNYIQYHDNLKRAIRYLPHLDTPTKYQYPLESVVSNFDLSRYLVVKAIEDKEIFILLEKIETGEIRTQYDLFHSGVSWSVIRRNYGLLRDYMINILFNRGYSKDMAQSINEIRDMMVWNRIESLFGDTESNK